MKFGVTHIALLALIPVAGCLLDQEESPERIGQVSSAVTIQESDFSKTESASWPKTVQWCVGNGHQLHTPFQWEVSWLANSTTTFTNCVSRQVFSETCNLSAEVLVDDFGHTSNPSYYSVFDYRPIVISPSAHTVAVGASVSLFAPAPHGTRHCDNSGSTVWQVKTSSGSWIDIGSSQNVNPWVASSPTAGFETYRFKSTHKGQVLYSNQVLVTWASTLGCTIGGTFYANGVTNPSNPCQICNASASTTSWSNDNNHSYNSGFCKGNRCRGGDCDGAFCAPNYSSCVVQCGNGTPACGA